MAFTYKHLTDEQLEALKPKLTEGVYDFEVIDAKEGKSSSGFDQITLRLKIIHQGRVYFLTDWLTFTDTMMWKIKHFFESTDELEAYLSDNYSAEICLNLKGKVVVKMGKDKENNPRPEVKDYFVQGKTITKGIVDKAVPFNDKLNF